MTEPIRDLHRIDLPRSLALSTGIVCGMLAAIVTQILLARRGIEFAGVWRDLFSTRGLQLRAAGAWWATAFSALLVGAGVAAALSRCPLPWLRLRTLRWLAGAAVVFALAHVGHSAVPPAGSSGIHLAASLAALAAAALMALFGAYFAARR